MANWRRAWWPGGTWFFTVNLLERRSQTRLRHGERGVWQRHYWEHLIRDEQDYRRHMDYIHINPLKHGHVTRVADWPYSTFHRYVASSVYPPVRQIGAG
ncbi:REP-associated tyrosine transposase [Aeromonas caviae]